MSGIVRFPPDLLPGAERQVSGREMRRHLERLEGLQALQGEAVAQAGPAMKALIRNQDIIKAHIEALETWKAGGFWARLRWLIAGQ